MGGGGAHITVDGATGYLGTHLTHKLLSSGFNVNCLVHPGASRSDMELLSDMGAEVFIGTLNQEDCMSPAVGKAFTGAIAAVHLIGSVAPKKGQSVEEMHAGQTHWFMEQVRRGRVPRAVVVTTLGTDEEARTGYQRSKWGRRANRCFVEYSIYYFAALLDHWAHGGISRQQVGQALSRNDRHQEVRACHCRWQKPGATNIYKRSSQRHLSLYISWTLAT